MASRPHKDRLLYDLKETRDELVAELARVKPEDFDWAPAEGMKSFKAQLQEIGTMEKVCVELAATGKPSEWEDAVAWSGEDLASTLSDLAKVRAGTVAYLEACTEDTLQSAVSLPQEWKQYFPVPDIEPEELIRWVIRHEYYHLGQIIIYNWQRGDNPYKRK